MATVTDRVTVTGKLDKVASSGSRAGGRGTVALLATEGYHRRISKIHWISFFLSKISYIDMFDN